MRELYLELGCGAAGDMLLAALRGAGANLGLIGMDLLKLGVEGWRIAERPVVRCGISAMLIEVEDLTAAHHIQHGSHPHPHPHKHPHEHEHCHGHEHPHPHKHGHEHEHGHSHEAPDAHTHSHSHGAHRHLADMLELAEKAPFSITVKARAAEVFTLLAEAEAHVHGTTPDKVHFHELSGIDTIIDVFGVLLALESLGVDRVSASPVATGSGYVQCAHGKMPVPAPATAEILRRKAIPHHPGAQARELLTPTGAALLGVLCTRWGASPAGIVRASGYGAGSADFPDQANVVRALLYQINEAPVTAMNATAQAGGDTVIEYRACLDDISGEEAGEVLARCYEAGALEAYFTPLTTKKSRPGFELTVLSAADSCAAIEKAILGGGWTLGLRRREAARIVLAREQTTVRVEGHEIRVKRGYYEGRAVFCKAEYDDCARAAAALGLPLREVRSLALRQLAQPE